MKQALEEKADRLLASADWQTKKQVGAARSMLLALDDGPPALRFEVDLDAPAAACSDYTIHRLLETHAEWNSSFVRGTVVDEDDSRLCHLLYKGQWPVKPRDFVYRAFIESSDDGGATELAASVEDERYPVDPAAVRGRIVFSWRAVVALSATRCRYVSIAQSDIGGRVPGWMVTPGVLKNMFAELGHIEGALAV